MPDKTVVIIGGGASGTLLGAALVRLSDHVRVSIIEPQERLGAGMAFATPCPLHLLNVPASSMSAFDGEPDHFLRWLGLCERGRYDAGAFIPRSVYGAYLHALANDARGAAGERWQHERTLAVDVDVDAGGVRVTGTNGRVIEGDIAVLASGNAAPAAWPNISAAARSSRHYFGSAWESGALAVADPNATVLLLGTGLTAIDAVLGLHAAGHRGRITMVSRRGLLPHEHRLFDTPPEAHPEATSVHDLIAAVRSRSWRLALDALRSRTNDLWQGLSLVEQRRFLRHVMPYWNVHRHRMAPDAALLIGEMIASGRLHMLAGRPEQLTADDRGHLSMRVRLRGTEQRVDVSAARVINCSGPDHDVTKLANPPMRSLLRKRLVTPHPLSVGLRVAASGALIDARGAESDRLFAIGPVRFGTLIETTAIPEIRMQAAELAERFASPLACRRFTA